MGATVRLTFQNTKNGLAYLRSIKEEKRVSYVVTSRELVRQVPNSRGARALCCFWGAPQSHFTIVSNDRLLEMLLTI